MLNNLLSSRITDTTITHSHTLAGVAVFLIFPQDTASSGLAPESLTQQSLTHIPWLVWPSSLSFPTIRLHLVWLQNHWYNNHSLTYLGWCGCLPYLSPGYGFIWSGSRITAIKLRCCVDEYTKISTISLQWKNTYYISSSLVGKQKKYP